jgi:hypothetical protein
MSCCAIRDVERLVFLVPGVGKGLLGTEHGVVAIYSESRSRDFSVTSKHQIRLVIYSLCWVLHHNDGARREDVNRMRMMSAEVFDRVHETSDNQH